MAGCAVCLHKNVHPNVCSACLGGTHFTPRIKTNADRIRTMSDEELSELFADNICGYCRIHDFCFAKGCQINCEDVWLDWLKQEAQP